MCILELIKYNFCITSKEASESLVHAPQIPQQDIWASVPSNVLS